MDTSDPEIQFDVDGKCNHCKLFFEVTNKNWWPNEEGGKQWELYVRQIKADGVGREYDCILGLSGGVDSSYLAIKAHEWGLRPLVMHVDAGWNSELAVANIESIVKHCNYDLHTHVVDWEDMRELHLAYLRAGISNQDVPQDHIFFSSIYHFATKNKIRYILSGGNIATESIFPKSWHGSAMDATNLKAIYSRFGDGRLKSYKTISFLQYYFWYPIVKKMRVFRPLNFMPYNKMVALAELEATVGYKPYPRKHGESIFTKWFQNHYLPNKFNIDKRRPHLSSMIVSGQLTRDEAINKLNEPLYGETELSNDILYVCKKLRISNKEYEMLMQAEVHSYADFKNWERKYKIVRSVKRYFTRITGQDIKISY
jgi:N-acetyl sugar amidotransferase